MVDENHGKYFFLAASQSDEIHGNISHKASDTFAQDADSSSSESLLTAYNDLHTKQRENPFSIDKTLASSSFQRLCTETLQTINRFSNPGHLVTILGTLICLRVPPEHALFKTVSEVLIKRCYALELAGILHLSHLLYKLEREHRVVLNRTLRKLGRILPMIYQIKFMDQIDHENCSQLTNILQFISSHPERFSSKAHNLAIASLRYHGSSFEHYNAKKIIDSLSRLPHCTNEIESLFKNVMESLAEQSLDVNGINSIVARLPAFLFDTVQYSGNTFEKFVNTIIAEDGNGRIAGNVLGNFNLIVSRCIRIRPA